MATKTTYKGFAVKDQGDVLGFINLDEEIDPNNREIKVFIDGVELSVEMLVEKSNKSRFRKSTKQTTSI